MEDDTMQVSEFHDEKSSITETHQFRGHLDGVRSIDFVPSMDVMITGSEDCTLQVWDMKLFQQVEEERMMSFDIEIEPYLTLRGHHSCVLSSAISSQNDKLVYSSSLDGIRLWAIPDVDDVKEEHYFNKYQAWDEHNGEPVWEIKHHPQLPILISAGADDSVGIWQCPSLDELEGGSTG